MRLPPTSWWIFCGIAFSTCCWLMPAARDRVRRKSRAGRWTLLPSEPSPGNNRRNRIRGSHPPWIATRNTRQLWAVGVSFRFRGLGMRFALSRSQNWPRKTSVLRLDRTANKVLCSAMRLPSTEMSSWMERALLHRAKRRGTRVSTCGTRENPAPTSQTRATTKRIWNSSRCKHLPRKCKKVRVFGIVFACPNAHFSFLCFSSLSIRHREPEANLFPWRFGRFQRSQPAHRQPRGLA